MPVGDDAWKLCDLDVAQNDPRHVLAYVEAADAGVDVVWVSHGPRHGEHCASLDEVRHRAEVSMQAESGPRSAPPITIPAFAPPRH